MTKKVVTNDGKKGGWLVGKRHYDKQGKPLGGIKAVVTDAGGKPVELEGGEVIINREASKKYWKELSRINQSAGNGVPIEPPTDAFDEDPAEDYENGGKIEFNANHIPNKWILNYAIKIKEEHPDVWALGGNIFGNQAFINLKRVAERGHWLDSEEWMYKKWRAFVARHKGDFRIQGVIAMLKWVDKVDKGWQYMKNLIEEEIKKREARKSKKMNDGGNVDTYNKGDVWRINSVDYYFDESYIDDNGIKKWKTYKVFSTPRDRYSGTKSIILNKTITDKRLKEFPDVGKKYGMDVTDLFVIKYNDGGNVGDIINKGYHGTQKKSSLEIKPTSGRYGVGIYLTPDYETAKYFGKQGFVNGFRQLDVYSDANVFEYDLSNLKIKKLQSSDDIDNFHQKTNYDGIFLEDEGEIIIYKTKKLKEGKLADKMRNGGNLSKTPAPASERIKGSKFNAPGTAKDSKSGANIKFDDNTLASIKSLIDAHNEKYPSKKITLGVAKAVVRRGMGAYSGTHRPTITGGKPNSRTAWGLARLKAFIYKAEKGNSKSGKYSQDNDLFDDLGIKVSKFDKGGEIEKVKSTEELIALVSSEREKLIKDWYTRGEKVVVGRNDGYWYNIPGKSDAMFISSRNPNKRKVLQIIKENPEVNEIHFQGAIKVGAKVGYELEIVDDFDVVLWKKGSEMLSEGMTFEFTYDDGKYINTIVNQNETIYKDRQSDDKYVYFKQEDKKYKSISDVRSKREFLQDDFESGEAVFVNKYENGGLIAPNGKPSNLSAEQYQLVRTPAFKDWFGDWENDPKNASKVVDENGEPKVMYRGNPQEQVDLGYTFNLGYNFLNKKTKNNFGFFFTDNLDIAHRYMKVSKWGEIQGGSVTQVFLNIKNLFDLTPLDLFTDGETFSNYLVSSGLKTKGYKELIKRISEYRYYEHKEQANVYGFFDKFPSLNTFFIYNKIDGVVFKEMSRAKFPYSTYVVFNSNQIKLADGSNTTFDSNNPDIRFAKGGGIEKEIPVRVDYLEQQLFENNKDIQVPNSVYKEYLKSGKVPKNIVDDLSSKIDEKHWIETTPLSVHLTPLNKMAKGGLIAPNGKLSNLTPEQYKLVRTPEFKAWFGDWENDPKNASKVVDENGEPLVVYRGDSSASKKGFIFKTGFNRMSYISKDRLPNQYFHYFVDNYDVALGYGQNQIEDHNEKVAASGKGKLWEASVTPYFLSIKNPIDITPSNTLFPTFSQSEKLVKKIHGQEGFLQQKYRIGYDYGFYITEADLNRILENKLGKDYLENTKETEERYSYIDEWQKNSFRNSYYPEKTFAYFIEYKNSRSRSDILRRIYLKMLNKNVDGMVFLESTNWKTDFFENWRKYESGELKYDSKRWVEKPKVFAALESNQIKLADGTNIKFDSENPDIRFEEGGNVDAKDSVTIDIPLMIRLLELSREDVKSDAELHFVVENLLKLKNKPVLTMDDYAFIADVEHNHLKKYDLGGKMPESEITVDLGFGGLGNGTTVWDRNRIHNNDYKIVAHISNEGKITYYDKKLPEYAISQIESMAENEKKRYEDMNGLSTGYDFNPIQTPLN